MLRVLSQLLVNFCKVHKSQMGPCSLAKCPEFVRLRCQVKLLLGYGLVSKGQTMVRWRSGDRVWHWWTQNFARQVTKVFTNNIRSRSRCTTPGVGGAGCGQLEGGSSYRGQIRVTLSIWKQQQWEIIWTSSWHALSFYPCDNKRSENHKFCSFDHQGNNKGKRFGKLRSSFK